MPSGESPGALSLVVPGMGAGTLAVQVAESLGLSVDRTARPPEGREGPAPRRTRLRPLAGDAPVGSAPLTGSADEEGGEGSAVRRRRRTILGAANVRRPVLSSAFGARFLGR